LRDACAIVDGDIVAVMLERDAAWPVALLGVLKAGATYLPLDLRHPPARRHELLRQSGARALIAAPADHAELSACGPLDLRLLPPADHARADQPPPLSIGPDDPAYLLFPSGSTGKPKGVRVQHRAFVNMILEQIRGFAIESDDVVMQLASC